MKTRILALSLIVAAATPSLAHISIYEGVLSGLNEVPQVVTTGTGFTRVTVDHDLMTLRLQTNFTDLIGTVTNSHIHVGNGPGTNGGVATRLPTFPGFPSGVTSGVFDATFDMAVASNYNPAFITANGGTVGTAFSALVTALDAGKAYHNIHSSRNAGGEIRADLKLVPEPGTMTALAVASLGLVARRRKRA